MIHFVFTLNLLIIFIQELRHGVHSKEKQVVCAKVIYFYFILLKIMNFNNMDT